MNKNIFFLFINISLQLTIKEGVYNLLWDNNYLKFDRKNVVISDTFIHPDTYFRIIKKNPNYDYYYLQIIRKNFLLSCSSNKELIFINQKEKNNLTEWKFIKAEKNI